MKSISSGVIWKDVRHYFGKVLPRDWYFQIAPFPYPRPETISYPELIACFSRYFVVESAYIGEIGSVPFMGNIMNVFDPDIYKKVIEERIGR